MIIDQKSFLWHYFERIYLLTQFESFQEKNFQNTWIVVYMCLAQLSLVFASKEKEKRKPKTKYDVIQKFIFY